MFAGRFVEPRLQVGGSETKLFDHFEGAGQRDRVTLLCGDGGTGKTSVMLALLERMIKRSEDDQETPIFVHCPWAEGLLTEEEPVLHPNNKEASGTMVGPIEKALCSALAIRNAAELEVLKRQRLLILLDSLDECPTSEDHSPGELLRSEPLLPRGGVSAENWPHARFVICCRREYLEMHELGPRELDRGPVTVCNIQPFTPEEQHLYVSKLAKQEVTLLASRLGKAADPAGPLAQMRCVPCTAAAAAGIKAAAAEVRRAEQAVGAVPDGERAAAETAVVSAKGSQGRARAAAVRQCEEGVNRVLASLPPGLLANPFVLFLACSASRELAETDLSVSPRYRIYAAWVRQDNADRIARAPELERFMPPTHDRADRLMDAASMLAIGMYARRLWQTNVGTCVSLLGGGESARAVLSVLPLRLESVKRDDCRVTWRHRTVQEFAIARGVLLPWRTSVTIWEAALGGPLESSPEAQAFIAEGARTLSEAEFKLLGTALGMAKETDNAVAIASLASFPEQQQQQMLRRSSSSSAPAATPAEQHGEVAALRIRLREQEDAAAQKIAEMQAELDALRERPPQETPTSRRSREQQDVAAQGAQASQLIVALVTGAELAAAAARPECPFRFMADWLAGDAPLPPAALHEQISAQMESEIESGANRDAGSITAYYVRHGLARAADNACTALRRERPADPRAWLRAHFEQVAAAREQSASGGGALSAPEPPEAAAHIPPGHGQRELGAECRGQRAADEGGRSQAHQQQLHPGLPALVASAAGLGTRSSG